MRMVRRVGQWLREFPSFYFPNWVGRMIFLLAAALSVVLVPLALIIFESSTPAFEWLSWFAGGASLVVSLAAVIVGFRISYSGEMSVRKEDARVEEAARALLIRELNSVLKTAEVKFPSLAGRTPIAMRSFLSENSVWSREDVLRFDEALRTRNEIVHAVGDFPDESVISNALESVRSLRQKIVESDFYGTDARESDDTDALSKETESSRVDPGGRRPLKEVQFITVAEVATIMRVSKMTVYKMVHVGILPAIRIGRSYRVPERAVFDYLDGVLEVEEKRGF